jgi:hypothetical protein
MSEVLFPIGGLYMTPGAASALEDAGEEPLPYIKRHVSGDWGEVDDEDKALNDESVKTGNRLLSAYKLSDGTKIWIITEADRSATTILLPEEY